MQLRSIAAQFYVQRGKICATLGGRNAGHSLLKELAVDTYLRQLLWSKAGIFENLSVHQHHSLVLSQQHKYRLGSDLPLPTSPDSPRLGERGLILALAMHDLDKHRAGEDKNKAAEHQRTLEIVGRKRNLLPLSEAQMATLRYLIGSNALGTLLRWSTEGTPSNKEKFEAMSKARTGLLQVEEYHHLIDRWEKEVITTQRARSIVRMMVHACARCFIDRASALKLHPLELLRLHTAFYQSDIASYSWDAKTDGVLGTPSLDYILARNRSSSGEPIFIKDHTKGRLRFSPFYEEIFCQLEDRVADLAANIRTPLVSNA